MHSDTCNRLKVHYVVLPVFRCLNIIYFIDILSVTQLSLGNYLIVR